jgi:hypothetical protein
MSWSLRFADVSLSDMTRRSVISVLILSLVTFGIYSLFWLVATKEELKKQGAVIPTAWLLIIPIANLYWMWKYSEGVEHVSRGRLVAPISFILLFCTGVIAQLVLQAEFNKLSDPQLPEARLA